MILACDVGGTKTNVALLEKTGSAWRVLRLERYPSGEHASLSEIVLAFLGSGAPQLEAAGFGVAGPVMGNRVVTTNLPWTVEAADLAHLLGLPQVSLLNDVEVQAWSLPELGAHAQTTLQDGEGTAGNLAVISAGSGLGMSALLRGDGAVRSLASEGGHADFAPIDDVEIELLRFLTRRFGRVSSERILAGPGLVNVYEFLLSQNPGEEAAWLATALAEGNAPATIAAAALSGRSELAEHAVLLFLGVYGAEAGNWALRTMSTGGMWLGGGIARSLLYGPPGTSTAWQVRARDAFLSRFVAKGRLSPLLAAMPVYVIMTDEAPLIGAARFALAEMGR